MATEFAPTGASFSVFINNKLVGSVESYEITTQANCIPLHRIGSPLPTTVAKGKMQYVVRLRHLLHDCKTLPIFRVADIWYPFELRIDHATWTETLKGCLCSSVTQSGQSGGTVAEELVCVAATRLVE